MSDTAMAGWCCAPHDIEIERSPVAGGLESAVLSVHAIGPLVRVEPASARQRTDRSGINARAVAMALALSPGQTVWFVPRQVKVFPGRDPSRGRRFGYLIVAGTGSAAFCVGTNRTTAPGVPSAVGDGPDAIIDACYCGHSRPGPPTTSDSISMALFTSGINHRTAPLSVRELVAIYRRIAWRPLIQERRAG